MLKKKSGAVAAVVGLAICLPCLIPLLLAAGLSAGAFGALGAGLSPVWLTAAAAACAVLLAVSAAVVVRARRLTRHCDLPARPRGSDLAREAERH